MLAQDHRDRGQLGDLVARGAPRPNPLGLGELAPTATARDGIVIDDLIELVLRGQLAPRPATAGLAARLALNPIAVGLRPLLGLSPRLRAPLLAGLRRILRRRL